MPTILDKVSSEAVVPFLKNVSDLTKDFQLDVRLTAAVASMTRYADKLVEVEQRYWRIIEDVARDIAGEQRTYFVSSWIPRRASITNEDDLGYFQGVGQNRLSSLFYDEVFDELWTRIMTPNESS